MKRLITLLGISALTAATALAQSTTTTNQTTTTVQPDGTVKTVQYTGEVVRYEPGKTIVLRQGTSPAVTYTLAPSLTVPAEVQVGRRVTVYTTPDPAGTTVVTRVITIPAPAAASGAPQSGVTTTRETTTQSAPGGGTTTTTKTTIITGDVVRIEPGRSIILRQPDSRVITYTLAPSLSIPAEVQTGRKVTIYTEPNDAGALLVTRVTTVAPEGTSVTRETVTIPEGSQTVTTRSMTTVAGEVVRYDPGQTIVIRQPDAQVVTYTISPLLEAPAEVQVGRRVVITTQPSSSGPVVVTRITAEPTAATAMETVTEQTMPSGTAEAQTTIYGTVSAYAPGKTITIVQPNKTALTYVVDTQSELPADLAVGKTVTIRTTTVTGSERPVVRKVTYRTTTQTTNQKTVS